MIIPLLIVLLMPVRGWAEQKTYPISVGDPVVHCWVYHEEGLGLVMEGQGCPKHMLPACHQRMQHAMIILDRLLDGIETERIKVGGVVYNNMKRQWNEVLGECARKR